ncbi:rhodanese-like domain-containing protein [Glaciihabitans sp. dw_435]|uniref:rhodanese-like domain-containing protein n=1 Tax=Glaciihabitans sp. dw_435 TaxID=2720081 RepID=UPI001BD5A3AD|nr:rhodanese-like domain-containing protein [Glaciihabitans sp. dw_435]
MADLTPISADQARARIEGGALLVDVRSEAGRESAGTITGATIVAKDEVAAFAARTAPDRDIVVFCGSIDGSGPFVNFLDEQGFSHVDHVDGGFDALRAAGVE